MTNNAQFLTTYFFFLKRVGRFLKNQIILPTEETIFTETRMMVLFLCQSVAIKQHQTVLTFKNQVNYGKEDIRFQQGRDPESRR